jgi:hypothetical protein
MSVNLKPIYAFQAVLAVLVAILFIFAILTGYAGRKELVENQRQGCIRGKADREDQSKSWRQQADADEIVSQDPGQPKQTQIARAISADRHRLTASELEKRAKINCAKEYPDATLLP